MSSIVIQGDTSGSITVEAPSVAGTHTLTLPKATGNIATDATVGLGTKNLIINGGMTIAQRATSFASLTTTGYRTVDRYYTSLSSIGTWTQTQSTDAPDGFANSLKMECTTADASPSASDYLTIQHRIEGQNLQHLKKGTANAESLTLSFWVKCNKTGNLQVNLRDFDNSRQIGNTYTINSADTWEKKTITFTGDTTGTLGNDNNTSLNLEWWFDSGSNYNSGSVPTSWQSSNDTNRNAGATINLADSTSNYINITGIQLELGENATPFENRMYGTELALCQRYYQKFAEPTNSYGMIVQTAYTTSTTNINSAPQFIVPMRAKPSSVTSSTLCFRRYDGSIQGGTFSATTIDSATNSTTGCLLNNTCTTVTAGWVGSVIQHNSASGYLAFSAEL